MYNGILSCICYYCRIDQLHFFLLYNIISKNFFAIMTTKAILIMYYNGTFILRNKIIE